MARTPDIWKRTRGGRLVSWYVTIDGKRIALSTKDANEARRRAREALAGNWPPAEEAAADASADAFTLGARSQKAFVAGEAGSPPVAPGPAQTPESDRVAAAGPASSSPPPPPEWTQAAAAAGAETTAPPLQAEVVNPVDEAAKRDAENLELAKLCVWAQLTAAAFYVRKKVWEGFTAPELPEEGKVQLAAPFKTMIDYGGAAIQLPPWVQCLVIPAITVIASTAGMAAVFADEARRQRAAAESSPAQGGA